MSLPRFGVCRRWNRLAVVVAVSLGAVSGRVEIATAQNGAPLVHPGARVRVFVADTTSAAPGPSDRIIGTLVEFREDSIVLRRKGVEEASTIPLEHVRRLEISSDRKSKAGSGALIGLGAGIAGGIVTGLVVCEDGECVESEGSTDYTPVVSAALAIGGGLVFAGLGAVAGSFVHTERWTAVPLPNARLGLRGQALGDLGVALTLRF